MTRFLHEASEALRVLSDGQITPDAMRECLVRVAQIVRDHMETEHIAAQIIENNLELSRAPNRLLQSILRLSLVAESWPGLPGPVVGWMKDVVLQAAANPGGASLLRKAHLWDVLKAELWRDASGRHIPGAPAERAYDPHDPTALAARAFLDRMQLMEVFP